MGKFGIASIVRAIFSWRALFVLIIALALLIPGVSLSETPDVTPPVTVMTLSGTEGLDGWFTSEVNVTLEATDDMSGVNRIRYCVDGENWTRYDGPFNVTNEGVTTVLYRARDNAGNREDVRRQDINIDMSAPYVDCTIDGVIIDGWFVDAATVTLNASDNTSGIKHVFYRINDSALMPYDGTFDVSGESEITLYYNTSDEAGNGYAVNATFKVDSLPPTGRHELEGAMGGNGWHISGISLLLNGLDNGSGLAYVERRWNGGEWSAGSGDAFSEDGIYHYEYRAVDNVGHTGETHVVDFKIDTTAPVTTPLLAGVEHAAGWYVSDVTVSLTSEDASSGVALREYSFDNDTWTAYEGPFLVSGQGMKAVYYRSTDVAGNLEPVKNVTFVIDTIAPVVMGTVPANGAKAAPIDGKIKITFSEPMDEMTLGQGSITVTDWYGFDVPGTIAYSGLTATFDPEKDLGPDFRYCIIVSKDVRDISGIPMGTDYTWSFKVAGVPQTLGTFVPPVVIATPTPAPTMTPMPSPSPTPVLTPSPSAMPSPTSEPTATPAPTPLPAQDESSPVYLGLLVLFLGIVALSGIAIYLVMFKKP